MADMSDTSQGDGWWQASDGKFYAPETHPDYQPPPLPVPASLASPPVLASQVPLRVVSLGERFASALLNAFIMVATVWVGWIVWALVLAAQKRGQSPAKQLLGHRVIIESTGEPAGLLRMFFVRGIAVAIIMSLASALVIPWIILGLIPFFRSDKATVWELISGTRVVYDA
jgi:uncharacterized RDD family membrane protein YckC